MLGCMLRRWRLRFEVSPFDGGGIGVLEGWYVGRLACKESAGSRSRISKLHHDV